MQKHPLAVIAAALLTQSNQGLNIGNQLTLTAEARD